MTNVISVVAFLNGTFSPFCKIKVLKLAKIGVEKHCLLNIYVLLLTLNSRIQKRIFFNPLSDMY